MIETDYYRLFRPEGYNAFSSSADSKWVGLIDPTTFVLRLQPEIRAILDSPKPIFTFNRSDEQMTATGVAIHEMMHWWQLCGTTLGLLHASCVNVQSNSSTSLLTHWIQQYGPKKSAFLAFRDAMVRNDQVEL